jgi:uncharacterized RDD family membrane protein YckC
MSMPPYPGPNYPGGPDGSHSPGYGSGAPAYSPWIKRVGAYLIDAALVSVPLSILFLVTGPELQETTENGVTTYTLDSLPIVYSVGVIAICLFAIWNLIIRQGKTGQSIGKSVLKMTCISEATGQPLGAGKQFLRQICHFLDSLLCYLGYLWPIWDSKRQTFADKIIASIVVDN